MNRRGVGIPCPAAVSRLLREAGWKGRSGYWEFTDGPHTFRYRWYEAVTLELSPRKILRRERDARQPDAGRCPMTPDMLEAFNTTGAHRA